MNERKTRSLGAPIVCLGVLLGAGVAHRQIDRMLLAADASPVALAQPLSSLPIQLGSWRGTDIPMDKRVLEVAGCDDHVCRRYTDGDSGQAIDLYVSYAARPAKMLSHRPQVCYPAQGWRPAGSRREQILLADGTPLECLIHCFTRNGQGEERVLVLNYYVLQGRYSVDWMDFWGPRWRLPNLSRNPSFYVAQVQISTLLPDPPAADRSEQTVKGFAAAIAPRIKALLPLPAK